MDILVLKLIFLAVVLVLIPSCAVIPLIISNRVSASTRDKFLSFGNAFAGGIFLAGGFVHLLAEANTEFQNRLENLSNIPFAMLLCPVGFLFAFFIEKVLFLGTSHAHSHAHAHGHAGRHGSDSHLSHGHGHEPGHSRSAHADSVSGPVVRERRHSHGEVSAPRRPSPSLSLDIRTHEEESPVVVAEDTALVKPPTPPEEETQSNPFLPYLLAFILSVHSIIGGLALGIQQDTTEATAVFVAIISHKWIEAFALGSSVLKNATGMASFWKIVYSMTTPFGILIGFGLEAVLSGAGGALTTAVFSALAAGTFVYVAVVDILVEEFSVPRHKFIKMVLCLIGLVSNSVLVLLFQE